MIILGWQAILRKFTNVVLFSISNCTDIGPVFCQNEIRHEWKFIRDPVHQNTVKPRNNKCEGTMYTYLFMPKSVNANKNEWKVCQGTKNSALVSVSTSPGSTIKGLYCIEYIAHSVRIKWELRVKLVYIRNWSLFPFQPYYQ